ncbi:MAG TPA: ABC transporter ATP-binding protein [Rhodospirillales bacterium]|mgnify:CR=1 FL=1|nr:ABC transporter ATP-binding protein [Rhodospirillales bacterium]
MTQHLPDNAVETVALSKTYQGSHGQPPMLALDDVTLSIPRGSFFGLLGPNGAGKSTLINILAGLVIRTSGSARIWGFDIEDDMRAARRSIGAVPQELNIDPFFTPREALDLQAGMYGVPKAARRTLEILDAVGLADKADVYSRTLSGGMRRRLLVGKALVHSPPVLVLDEPTAGVDVDLRRQLWAYIRGLNANGTTILLTTHYLQEAQELCDTIAIINHGKLIACEPKSSMMRRLDAKEITLTLDQDISSVPEQLGHFHVELSGPRQLRFCYPPSNTNSGEILAAVQAAGLVITEIDTRDSALEDVFISLTSAQSSGTDVP